MHHGIYEIPPFDRRENNEIPAHFTHEIRKKRNDIIHLKIAHDLIFMRFLRILFMRKKKTSLAHSQLKINYDIILS